MTYLYWAILLVIQNASFTWVSRARNSGSDWYHALASVFSNGVWFFAFVFTFNLLDEAKASGSTLQVVGLGTLYVACTVTGSVTAGKFLRAFVEKGSRRVGAYNVGEGK